MPNQIIVLPPDAVFKTIPHPDYPALTVFSIVLGEAIIGTGMFGNGVFVREVVTDPDSIPEPTPAPVLATYTVVAEMGLKVRDMPRIPNPPLPDNKKGVLAYGTPFIIDEALGFITSQGWVWGELGGESEFAGYTVALHSTDGKTVLAKRSEGGG